MTREEKSKLLISYKKSNKERRVKILQKYNMDEAAFLLFLSSNEITSNILLSRKFLLSL